MHDIGAGPIQNYIEMVAFLTKPATLQIEIAGRLTEKQAGPGAIPFEAPARIGVPVFRIVREGRAILEQKSAWQIEAHPDKADPLYVGGASTRQICRQAGCG